MNLPATMQAPNGFRFEEPPGRPFRAISMETEVDGAGMELSKVLYQHGIISAPRVQPYGWMPDPNHPHVAFLKHDGSVSAGELVFDRLFLNNKSHAEYVNQTLDHLRRLEKAGHISYNPNCGGHIHMDAHGYGFFDLVRLMNLYGFLEEPIHRLAGSGKSYGHRSLFKGYDRANHGGGYSNPVVKGPFVDVKIAMNKLQGQNRMSGLNATLYFAARCMGCGKSLPVEEKEDTDEQRINEWIQREVEAFRNYHRVEPQAGDMAQIRENAIYNIGKGKSGRLDLKDCTCRHPKLTLEWRVWNSQGNPKILYAWIAVMEAMHAYAWHPSGDNYRNHEPMNPLAWTQRPYNQMDDATKKVAKDRVEFMFTELPLTSEEKDALKYAFMRTPYKEWGADFFRRRANEPYKKPPFDNSYVGISERKLTDPKKLASATVPLNDPVPSPFADNVPMPAQPRRWNNIGADIQYNAEELRVEMRPPPRAGGARRDGYGAARLRAREDAIRQANEDIARRQIRFRAVQEPNPIADVPEGDN